MTTSVPRSGSGSISANLATIEKAIRCMTMAKAANAMITARARRGRPAVNIDHHSRHARRNS
jgi:hypothetical protein